MLMFVGVNTVQHGEIGSGMSPCQMPPTLSYLPDILVCIIEFIQVSDFNACVKLMY